MFEQLRIIKVEDFETGFDRLRKARLENAGGQTIYNFTNANFNLANFAYTDILPSTFYGLHRNLAFQRELRQVLLGQNIDSFNLPGLIYFSVGEKITGLGPPIVERYTEENGEVVTALQDGIHRFLLARELNVMVNCIFIDDISMEYLPYAYPNAWAEVVLQDQVPAVKKKYRRSDHYTFLHSFKSIFDKSIENKAEYGRR